MDLETSTSLIEAYKLFIREFYRPKSVLYPCCGFDKSAAEVFDRVTFVDRDAAAIGAMQKAGLNAIVADIRQFTPIEQYDLLLLLNPQIRSEVATQHIPSSAHIIANNYHGNASQLHSMKFDLVGAIDDDKLIRDLSGFFVSVASLDELRTLDSAEFEFIKGHIPHSLGRNPKDIAELEQMYKQWKMRLYKNDRLPFKRSAGLYFFRKQ